MSLLRALLVPLFVALQLAAPAIARSASCAVAGGGAECCCAGHVEREPASADAHAGCCGEREMPASSAPERGHPCDCVVAPDGAPATAPEALAGLERPVLALALGAGVGIERGLAPRVPCAARGPLPGERPPRWLEFCVVRR